MEWATAFERISTNSEAAASTDFSLPTGLLLASLALLLLPSPPLVEDVKLEMDAVPGDGSDESTEDKPDKSVPN